MLKDKVPICHKQHPCHTPHLLKCQKQGSRKWYYIVNFILQAPQACMTDNSAAEKAALHATWPQGIQLLCHFHVAQAEWRWLQASRNNVSRDKRRELMFAFQKVCMSILLLCESSSTTMNILWWYSCLQDKIQGIIKHVWGGAITLSQSTEFVSQAWSLLLYK